MITQKSNRITGKELIKYVRSHCEILNVKEIELYTNARICGSTIEAWESARVSPRRLHTFRLEQAIQRRAIALGIKRQMNEEIFNY